MSYVGYNLSKRVKNSMYGICVLDEDYYYMVTLVDFMTIHNHHKFYRSNGKTITLKKQCKIVDYFRPSKIAINFVFI